MKAVLAAVIAMVLISVVAGVALNMMGRDTASMQQSPRGSVRL